MNKCVVELSIINQCGLLRENYLVQTFVFQLNIVVSLTCTFSPTWNKKYKGLSKRHGIINYHLFKKQNMNGEQNASRR